MTLSIIPHSHSPLPHILSVATVTPVKNKNTVDVWPHDRWYSTFLSLEPVMKQLSTWLQLAVQMTRLWRRLDLLRLANSWNGAGVRECVCVMCMRAWELLSTKMWQSKPKPHQTPLWNISSYLAPKPGPGKYCIAEKISGWFNLVNQQLGVKTAKLKKQQPKSQI